MSFNAKFRCDAGTPVWTMSPFEFFITTPTSLKFPAKSFEPLKHKSWSFLIKDNDKSSFVVLMYSTALATPIVSISSGIEGFAYKLSSP